VKQTDPVFTQSTKKQIEELHRLGWYHSIQLRDGSVIPGLQSIELLQKRIAQFPIPQDLTGKRVLDIGAWDGWFSFEMERRGAEVVAVDSTEHKKFLVARDLLGSKVEYVIEDVCRLSPERLGYFDIVLFFGVLYHLKHPLLGLEKVCELATDMACIESFVTDDGSDLEATPRMDFYETSELRGQFDNWCGPNVACLLAFARTAGFPRARLESVMENRAHVTCFRKWETVLQSPGPAPVLTCVENAVSLNFDFSSNRDDYISMWFKTADANLTVSDVFPQVDEYGSRPVSVRHTGGDGWHLNCKLPPGLKPGWHYGSLRIRNSDFSNRLRIGVDVANEPVTVSDQSTGSHALAIAIVADGKTWERNLVHGGIDSWVSLWVRGMPPDARREETMVRVSGTELPAFFLSDTDQEGLRQINLPLPYGLKPGKYWLTVVQRGAESAPSEFELAAQ